MRTDNGEDAFQLIPVGMRTEKPEDAISTQSGSQRRGAQTRQGRHTRTHRRTQVQCKQQKKKIIKKYSVSRWIYTRSCIGKQQSQRAQFDITEQLKPQMTNPRRDGTDIKHPEQLQQLQTSSGLALRPMPRHSEPRGCPRLPSPRLPGKLASVLYRWPISKEAQRAGAPSLSGNRNHSRDQDSNMRGGTELLQ